MNQADRDASIFELVLRSIVDLRKDTPEFLTAYKGLVSLHKMLNKASLALVQDDKYGCYIFVLMMAGLSHKFLFELMPDYDITSALLESSFFGERHNANRKSPLQRNKNNIQPEGSSDN